MLSIYLLYLFSNNSIIQQYSAMGSIVETDCDESIDDNEELGGDGADKEYLTSVWCVDGSSGGNMRTKPPSLLKINRSLILASMKKRLRMEASSLSSSLSPSGTQKTKIPKTTSTWHPEEDDDLDEDGKNHADYYSGCFQDPDEGGRMEDKDGYCYDEEQEVDNFGKRKRHLEDQHLVAKTETNLEQDMGRKKNGVELLTKKRKRGKRHEDGEMMSNGGMGLTNNEAKKKLAADAHHDSSDREEEITAKVAMRKMGPSSSNHAEEYYYEDEDYQSKRNGRKFYFWSNFR